MRRLSPINKLTSFNFITEKKSNNPSIKKKMRTQKDLIHKSSKTPDSQFTIWKTSEISERKFSDRSSRGTWQRSPTALADANTRNWNEWDEVPFPSRSVSRKMRSLNLPLRQTKILATLLPDAVINISDLSKDITDTFAGVLLFADVSGFTALCEKYNGFGKSGSDKLTATLNSYLGAIVEVIYKYGGDVLKFSGDALLALWKLDKNEYIYILIHRVICCALYIQNRIGVYETEVKVLLKVKLAISAGNMTFVVIGDDNSRHYLVVGSPVYEVKSAEQACTSGEVILSFSAWGHLSPVNYEYSWKDNEHIKINRIIYSPENAERVILRSDWKETYQKNEHRFSRLSKDIARKKTAMSSTVAEVRPLVQGIAKGSLCSELRTFLIPSVIQQIDADLPLEYLSEMRNVTVMFINIVPNRLHTRRLINMVHKAYVIICSLAYKATGSVNKVSLFDKDVMVLVIFGLRGFSHDGEVAGCLKCGYDIRHACSTLDGVLSISVGVTTGQTYCGVVGHPLRREYTVIGAAVNKAARLMCAYPGKVICDQATFLFSNLSSSFFTIQEKRSLKGIEDTGPVYEFTRDRSKNALAAMSDGMYPILGREREIQTFHKILQYILMRKSWEKAILLTGQARIGKTRLLDEMVIRAQERGFTSTIISLRDIHSTLPYGTVQCIIKEILDIQDSASVEEREHKLSAVLKYNASFDDYWYLNEVMNVKFPKKSNEISINVAKKFEKIRTLFQIILIKGTRSIIFAIDDMQHCDELSWKLLTNVIKTKTKFLLMTMTNRLRPNTAKFLRISPDLDNHILQMPLTGLSDNLLAILACQMLNAKAVPKEVERILIERSCGNPGWCESFLLSLLQSNALKIEELYELDVKRKGLIVPPESYLKRKRHIQTSKNSHLKFPAEKLKNTQFIQEDLVKKKKYFNRWSHVNNTKPIKFGKWKDNLNINRNPKYRQNNKMLIEEAYEDLRQRIQLIRTQSKLSSIVYFNGFLSEGDLMERNSGSEGNEPKNRGGIIGDEGYNFIFEMERFSTLKKEASETPWISSIGFSQLPERCTGGFNDLDTFKDEDLKQRINYIRHRYSSMGRKSVSDKIKTQGQSNGSAPMFEKSLEDLRKVENIMPNASKSADALLNNHEEFIGSAVMGELLVPNAQSSENLPSILWQTHTEMIMDKSIKIFLKNKMKKENVNIGEATKNMFDTASGLHASSSSLNYGFSLEIGRGMKSESLEGTENSKHISLAFREQLVKPNDKDIILGGAEDGESFEDTLSIGGGIDMAKSEGFRMLNTDQLAERYPKASASSNESEVLFEPSYARNGERHKNWYIKFADWIKKRPDKLDNLEESPLVDGNRKMPVILVSPNVALKEITSPEYFVRVIMSAFDCLGPYEQLMLKCGSIIGERFSRKMLNAIMHNPNPVLTAEAVKRLFEMQILCCADERVLDYNYSNCCRCVCPLTSKDIVDDNLPKYSFCRTMLFKYAMFRSTIYELIPLDQKREFHTRAVEFLEKEQNYCTSCKISKSDSLSKSPYDFSKYRFSFEDTVRESHSRTSARRKRQRLFSESGKSDEKTRRKKSEKESTKTFLLPTTLPSFQKCECLILQADALSQLIDHCTAAGLKKKEIEFVIYYSFIMITLGEFGEATKLLNEVEFSVKSITGKSCFKRKEKRFLLGKIHMLLGKVNLEIGELKKANNYLVSSLNYFGSGFTSFYPFRSLQYAKEYLVQILQQNYPFITRFKRSHQDETQAMCLSLLSNVFMLQNKWELAKLVALRSVNVLGRGENVIELCNAYSNAIDVYRHFGNFKLCRRLEGTAIKSCMWLIAYRSAVELIAVGRLNSSILNARLMSGYLFEASKYGKTVLKICQSISSHQVESYVYTQVAQTMMLVGRLKKAVGLILLLPVQNIWHYILSLEFILETGHVLKSSAKCLDAISNELKNTGFLNAETEMRALSVLYVWNSRLGDYEAAEHWSKKLSEFPNISSPDGTLNNIVTVLKTLEGDLINLSTEAQNSRSQLNKKIATVMKVLRKTTRKTKVMLPRYLHLSAYYEYQANNMDKALRLLREAKKISISQGNVLERLWLSHSEEVWTNTCDYDENLWEVSAKGGIFKHWSENQDVLKWKNSMYSFQKYH